MVDLHKKFKPQPIIGSRSGLRHRKKFLFKNIAVKFSFVFVLIIFFITVAIISWCSFQLSPVNRSTSQLVKFTIKPGSSSTDIGKELKEKSIIRSSFMFNLYAVLSSQNSKLQAGTYRLSPAESVSEIIEHFVKGNIDNKNITFYPGATLADNSDLAREKKQDATTVLENAGYSIEEINAAFNIANIGPLFVGKPETNGIEGYIFGETYQFADDATVEHILQTVFDEFYDVIESEDLINKFAKHGLNLYQGIILASIVQRESSDLNDQRQIAQVFYSRLNQGVVLGSDVTYQYIADKEGIARSSNLDSPYNTRRYVGLPPGPISSPGLSALRAVAEPAPGSYMYFLSGDDNKTYFAYTEDEHNANRINYCQKKCSAL